jgi:hypothetical protein
VVGASDRSGRRFELASLSGKVLDVLHALRGPCGGNGRRGRGARGLVAVACCGTRGLRVVLVLGEVAHENVSSDGRVLAEAAVGR